MEDTIDSMLFDPFKGQIFRITYKTQDYQIKLLKRNVEKNQLEIDILLDGIIQKIIKKNEMWCFENIDLDKDFAYQIWRTISLRYRL
ncbi:MULTISPECIES: hypothetical protein [Sphingobacterium]|uniref:hypothetical protein n=1 Tax=Sphingobacterium TaxID=28453 RepID=UPI002581058D|nr:MULTISPECIES: hypothetical protein [Sphingobacterium]